MNPIRFCIAILLLVAATGASAQMAERRYTLPDHGRLVLLAPAAWKESIQQPTNRLPPTITFVAAAGKLFQVMLTPLWPPAGQAPMTPEQLRALTEKTASDLKSQASEPELRIVEFQGKSGPGFYFSAIDKAPRPDE